MLCYEVSLGLVNMIIHMEIPKLVIFQGLIHVHRRRGGLLSDGADPSLCEKVLRASSPAKVRFIRMVSATQALRRGRDGRK